MCRDNGAKSIVIGATHAVLCGSAIERLSSAPIDAIVVTDTIPIPDEKREALDKLVVLSISDLIGEAINRIHNNDSVSSLFKRHMETQ